MNGRGRSYLAQQSVDPQALVEGVIDGERCHGDGQQVIHVFIVHDQRLGKRGDGSLRRQAPHQAQHGSHGLDIGLIDGTLLNLQRLLHILECLLCDDMCINISL